MKATLELAVIGGTGLYTFPGLSDVERHAAATRWGVPSAPIVVGTLAGRSVAFLARHGEAHTLAPHRINYRANLAALHQLGARRIVGINAVGGIRRDMAPRALAVPDQLIDYTSGRSGSFCDADNEPVVHIDFSEPYSATLRHELLDAAHHAGVPVIDGGCYGATQGPRLETVAEIRRMRCDGCDLVGMTGMPEAALARELGIDYACIAGVANWAAGCDPQHAVEISLEEIHRNLAVVNAQVRRILGEWLKNRITQ